MDKTTANINTLIVEIEKQLIEHKNSLQKEFEFFITMPSLNEKALLSKKYQIRKIDNLLNILDFLFRSSLIIDSIKFKLEALLILNGYNPEYIVFEMNKPIYYFENKIKEKQSIQKLEQLREDLQLKTKIATKPVFKLHELKEMARKKGSDIFKD